MGKREVEGSGGDLDLMPKMKLGERYIWYTRNMVRGRRWSYSYDKIYDQDMLYCLI